MTDEPRETLRRMEQRLAAASDAAERLIVEATGGNQATRGDQATRGNQATAGNQATTGNQREKPPPAGWQVASTESERSAPPGLRELELLFAGVRLMREVVPAEVLERLIAALRELLLAARALIDFYLERLERPDNEPTGLQDIPIE